MQGDILSKTSPDFSDLADRLRLFANVRDWQQFHSPKNLAMALTVEAAELLEHFQWLTEEQSLELSADKIEEVALEMADILIYLTRMADRLDIDLPSAVWHKIEINEKRFPVNRVKGKAT